MKKRIRRLIALTLVMSSICGIGVCAEEKQTEDSLEHKKQVLHEKGMENDEIKKFDSDSICYIYDKVLSEGTEEIEVLEETQILDVSDKRSDRAVIPTSKLKVTCYTVNYADEEGLITGCDVSINYYWLENPAIKGTDAIILNWDSELFRFSGYMNGYNTVKNISNNTEDYFNFISSATLTSDSGIGWYTELLSPNIPIESQNEPSGGYYISFEPSTEFYAQDNIVSFFNLKYYHELGTEIILDKVNDEISAVTEDNNMDTYSRRIAYASKIINN